MEDLNTWHWFILACVLLAIEVTAPVTFFLWLAGAALASTLVAYLFPALSWQFEIALFGVFSFASLVAWHFLRPASIEETDQPALNQRNEQYLNKVLVVTEAITGGTGRVKANDSLWKAVGEDAKVGTKVKVVRVEGSIFHVEAV